MRRSPQSKGPLIFALILALCLLLLTMLTPIAAYGDDTDVSDGGHLAVSMMQSGEDGRVTDQDGLIGNGQDGADHAEPDDMFEKGMGDRTAPEARDAAPEAGDMMPGGNGTASDGNSLGILPWIITALVVLAVVLVVLALIPKKNKSH